MVGSRELPEAPLYYGGPYQGARPGKAEPVVVKNLLMSDTMHHDKIVIWASSFCHFPVAMLNDIRPVDA